MKLPITQADAGLTRARRLLHDHRSRAKRDGAALDYGLPEVRQMLAAATCCRWCRMPVGWDATLDHVQPISRGGRHALANVAVCCRRRNFIKGALTGAENGCRGEAAGVDSTSQGVGWTIRGGKPLFLPKENRS
jgi:5-methylcytosine-specific restriction endonuclease McrA